MLNNENASVILWFWLMIDKDNNHICNALNWENYIAVNVYFFLWEVSFCHVTSSYPEIV